jgi:ABC-type polar amino acid transport system ATPase subunit
MIELKNVSKWYGPFQVLTECSTKMDKGDVVSERAREFLAKIIH